MTQRFFVYILASGRYGTLYIGMTSNLSVRLAQHRAEAVKAFTRRYGVHRLVHYEIYEDLMSARERERRMKEWRRDWKVRLIEESNPGWDDLAGTLVDL